MKKVILMCLTSLLALSAVGCNTMEGVGEDIQQGGAAIEDAAEENK